MDKIKIFTNHFYPENFKINDLALGFSETFDVEVITQIPNYGKSSFYEDYSPFKRRIGFLNKIKIKRLLVLPRKSSNFSLSLNYLTYIISSYFYSKFTPDESDHVFVYVTSPIFIAWAGLRLAKRNNVKSTLYLLDLWPGSLISIFKLKNNLVIKLLTKICLRIYLKFDNIVVSSKGFIDVLVDYGIDEKNIYYIPQHSENVDSPRKKNRDTETGCLNIVFTGNIGEAQGLDILVEAAHLLKERDFERFHFNIVGSGRYTDKLKRKISSMQVNSFFTFTGQVDVEQIPEILDNNDFAFLSLIDDFNFNKTIPAKLQSYMSNGIPILAAANGQIPEIIEEAKCGISVPANDAEALSEKIIAISTYSSTVIDKMSVNAINYSERYFNKNQIIDEFIRIFDL